MIGELVSAATSARAHATQADGHVFWGVVAAAWWGFIAVGTAVNIPKFRRMPVEKRPIGWILPAMIISVIYAAFQLLVALSRL